MIVCVCINSKVNFAFTAEISNVYTDNSFFLFLHPVPVMYAAIVVMV